MTQQVLDDHVDFTPSSNKHKCRNIEKCKQFCKRTETDGKKTVENKGIFNTYVIVDKTNKQTNKQTNIQPTLKTSSEQRETYARVNSG